MACLRWALPLINMAVPNEVCVRIARGSTVWEIEELMDVIKQDVEAREVSKSVKITEERNQKPPSYLHKNLKYTSANSLVTKNDHPTKKTSEIRCVYCSDLHYSASCMKVTSPNNRRNILVESKRCFKCLFHGHQLKDCKSKRNCCNCGGRHHQSICLRGYRESQPTDSRIMKEEATTSMKKAKGSICYKLLPR